MKNGFSLDTELLTDKGWKSIRDIDIGNDTVFSMNPDNGVMEETKIRQIERYKTTELLHFANNRSYDFCVTRGTPILRVKKHLFGYYSDFTFTSSERLKPQHYFPLGGFEWFGRSESFFKLPAVQGTSAKSVILGKTFSMDAWMSFLGFWLACGHCESENVISIRTSHYTFQSIIDLISRMSLKYEVVSEDVIHIYSKRLWLYLNEIESEGKYIPRELLTLHKGFLNTLYRNYIRGMGGCMSTDSQRLAEDFQELMLKLYGAIPIITTGKTGTYSVDMDTRTFKRWGYAARCKNPSTIQVDTEVYGISVNHNNPVLTRRNGFVVWLGTTTWF